jgi:hypothetical protein
MGEDRPSGLCDCPYGNHRQISCINSFSTADRSPSPESPSSSAVISFSMIRFCLRSLTTSSPTSHLRRSKHLLMRSADRKQTSLPSMPRTSLSCQTSSDSVRFRARSLIGGPRMPHPTRACWPCYQQLMNDCRHRIARSASLIGRWISDRVTSRLRPSGTIAKC